MYGKATTCRLVAAGVESLAVREDHLRDAPRQESHHWIAPNSDWLVVVQHIDAEALACERELSRHDGVEFKHEMFSCFERD